MEQLFSAIQRLARSPAFKFFLVTFLILMLLVPLALVFGLVNEREGRARQVQGEVARVWGAAQQLSGPFLVVPYTVRVETVQGDKRIEQMQERRAVFLPEQLDIKARRRPPRCCYRSIYEVAVYTARAKLEGRFLAPDMADVASDVRQRALERCDFRARPHRRVRPEGGRRSARQRPARHAVRAEPRHPECQPDRHPREACCRRRPGAGRARSAAEGVRVQAGARVRWLHLARRRARRTRDAHDHDIGLAASELFRRVPARRAERAPRRLLGELARAASGAQRTARVEPHHRRHRPLPALSVRRPALPAGRLLQSGRRAR